MSTKKKATKKTAPRKAARKQKLKFVSFVPANGQLLGIDKNNDVYYWNALDRAWVPNWDVDGSVKAAIELQRKQEEEKRQAANAPVPAGAPLNRQQRRAIKAVAGVGAQGAAAQSTDESFE